MTTPPRDRIKRVRFAGLRTAANVELELEGLTVLIGQNGVGKTTLVEGIELLRQVMVSEELVRTIYDEHGGPSSLVTHGARELGLGVDVVTEEGSFAYGITLGSSESGFGIIHESLAHRDGIAPVFDRVGDVVTAPAQERALKLKRPRAPYLPMSVHLAPTWRLHDLLSGIEIHGPFRTTASWLLRGSSGERSTRSDNVVQATSRVERGGINLPNAFHALRNRDDWQDTIETIRLVVDEDIRDVLTPASASGGSIGLEVKYRTGTVPAFALSDGTLALLSLVAITSLDGGAPARSLLVLDEPDLHLHPAALRYVVALLERCAKNYPVVVATHSDQLLDCLSEPARSIVLCDIDHHRRLRLRRPDAALLDKWLAEYRGVGHLRAEGYDGLIFPEPVRASGNS